VAGNLWASLLARVAGPAGEDAPDRELRLTGDLHRLDQLVTVRPHTVVVVFEPGASTRLAHPGDYLLPRLRRSAHPTMVLVVNTAPVELDVTVDRLRSFDRFDVGEVTLRLTVRLVDADDDSLLRVVAGPGADLESYLLGEITSAVSGAARAVVGAYPAASLRDANFMSRLVSQWLPPNLAGGVLSWSEVAVVGGLGRHSFTLERDPELAALWDREVGVPLRGIAAAQVATTGTVIAVPTEPLSGERADRAQIAFSRHFRSGAEVLAPPATTCYELVQAWFTHVDGSARRLLSVEADDLEVLRIHVSRELMAAVDLEVGLAIGSRSQRAALRRLVPHRRLEFVAQP
jgi:hypothetical protein